MPHTAASKTGDISVIETALLFKGIGFDSRDSDGSTSMMFGAANGHWNAFQCLMNRVSDPTV